MVSGATNPIDRLINAVASVLPLDDEASPTAQRERMREYAGTNHFAQEELAAGRTEMARHRAEFAEQRQGFASPHFAESRQRFLTGRTRPVAGPVLGGSVSATLGNPNLARSLLTGAAATQGVPVVPVNPILAEVAARLRQLNHPGGQVSSARRAHWVGSDRPAVVARF